MYTNVLSSCKNSEEHLQQKTEKGLVKREKRKWTRCKDQNSTSYNPTFTQLPLPDEGSLVVTAPVLETQRNGLDTFRSVLDFMNLEEQKQY